MQKVVTEVEIKEYQTVHDTILKKLVNTKRTSDNEKQELVLRLIEVSEPLANGKLCKEPQDLCISLWKELEVNGLSGWISYQWFSEQ